jgi:four helix bundle protein
MARIKGDLGKRTYDYGQLVLRISDDLPSSMKGWVIGKQLIRSGTSVGACIREADNALTDAEFANKCSIARKECAESNYWLDLSRGAGLLQGPMVDRAIHESDEITRILATVTLKTQASIRRTSSASRARPSRGS